MNLQGNRKNRLLSVGAAALRAGVTVDTIRAWERAGRLAAHRTPGGQRRFREEDIDALLRTREGSATGRAEIVRPVAPEKPNLQLPRTQTVGDRVPAIDADLARSASPHRRVADARADLVVLRAQREAEQLQAARQQEVEKAARSAYAELIRCETQRRLETLKAHGRSFAGDAPPEWRAWVVRDLETFVTADQFPSTLADWDARSFVEARVRLILAPYHEELARAQERDRRRELRRNLLDFGNRRARMETTLWDDDDAQEVRQELRRELERQVRWDWTEENVRSLVDRILEEWEDEGDAEDEEEEGEDEWDDEDDGAE